MSKNINNWLSLSLLALLLAGFAACVKSDFDEPAPGPVNITLVPNTSIKALKALHTTAGSYDLIEQDLVISGTVVMDDRSGNYYKTISIQDSTGGVDVKFNDANAYTKYKVGSKIYINCKGLIITDYNGLPQLIGGTADEAGVAKAIGITEQQVRAQVQGDWSESTPTPRKVKIEDLNDDMLSTLVQIDGVQFIQTDAGKPYAEPISQTTLNRTIQECDGGKIVLVRTSGFASFAAEKTPLGQGSIVCVVSKYSADYQLYIRDLRDVNFTADRCGSTLPQANTKIGDLKATYNGNPFEITEDKVIAGKVIMDDRSGNYYKTIVIQDETGGIEIKINATNLYQNFPVGQDIIVRLKGLFIGDYNNLVQIGGDLSGAQLSAQQAATAIFDAGTNSAPVPRKVGIGDLSPAMVSTLIEFEGVEFLPADTNKTYADAVAKKSINHNFKDCNGLQCILRTSGFADFAAQKTPGKNGSIVGVLGVYQSDFQIYVRDLSDVNMTESRCGGGNPSGPLASMNEGFDAVTLNADFDLAGWYNIATAGTKKWRGRAFSGDSFAEATAFQSNLSDMQTWLITPALNLTVPRTLQFESAMAFHKHDGLTVWVSNNFDGQNPNAATWTQLDCDLAGSSQANYDWVPSGLINLPVYPSGVGHVAFKYVGNTSTQTTTFRVDDVKMQ